MWLYRILLAFDILVVVVLAFFFVDGLQYHSGAPSIYWLPMLGIPLAVITASVLARERGRTGLANALLLLLALPPLLYILFFGLLFATVTRWN